MAFSFPTFAQSPNATGSSKKNDGNAESLVKDESGHIKAVRIPPPNIKKNEDDQAARSLLKQLLPQLKDGLIRINKQAKIEGPFKIMTKGKVFDIEPKRFKGRFFTELNQNPEEETFYIKIKDLSNSPKFLEKFIVRFINKFYMGLDFTLTRDDRLVIIKRTPEETDVGYVLVLNDRSFTKYYGKIENLTAHGLGKMTLKNGEELEGLFQSGHLHGLYINAQLKKAYKFERDIKVKEINFNQSVCRDQYLGSYQLLKSSCSQFTGIDTAINFSDKTIVYQGKFIKGQLISGEIKPLGLYPAGFLGTIQEGKPYRTMTIHQKDKVIFTSLQNQNFHGHYNEINKKNGVRFIGQLENGIKNGPFRILSYYNVVKQKGNYIKNKLDGDIYNYDHDANITSIETYKEGKLISKKLIPPPSKKDNSTSTSNHSTYSN